MKVFLSEKALREYMSDIQLNIIDTISEGGGRIVFLPGLKIRKTQCDLKK